MSRTRYRFCDNRQPHFLTCTVVAWLPVFTRPEAVQIVLDSWRFLQNENRITLLGYVVLENHLHFIAAAENLGKEVGDFKSYTAKSSSSYLSGQGPIRCPNSFNTTSSATGSINAISFGKKAVSRS